MRLVRFKITNFRSVTDSGWVDADQVTALVGVNESGKTNLLLPLWKLNPAREGEIQPTSDYPKANYAAIRANPGKFTFVTAQFDTSNIVTRLEGLTGLGPAELDIVQISKAFDGKRRITFPGYKPIDAVKTQDLLDSIRNSSSQIESSAPLAKEGTLKKQFLAAIESAIGEIEGLSEVSPIKLTQLIGKLKDDAPESPAPTSSIAPPYLRLIEELTAIEAQLNAPSPADAAGVGELILDNLPRFVFYSNYGNLDSEIYLPHVVENLKREDLGAREAAKSRTLRVLFSFVQLEPDEILELIRLYISPTCEA